MLGEWEPVLRAGASGKEGEVKTEIEGGRGGAQCSPFVSGALLWHRKSKR